MLGRRGVGSGVGGIEVCVCRVIEWTGAARWSTRGDPRRAIVVFTDTTIVLQRR